MLRSPCAGPPSPKAPAKAPAKPAAKAAKISALKNAEEDPTRKAILESIETVDLPDTEPTDAK